MSANYCEKRPTRGKAHTGPCVSGVHCMHLTTRTQRCWSRACKLRHPIVVCFWCGDKSQVFVVETKHGEFLPRKETA